MRKRLAIDLGDDHQAWLDLAKSLDQRPNTLARIVLKGLIEEYKQGKVDKSKYQKIKSSSRHNEDTNQIKIRLNPNEIAHLKSYAKEFDYSVARAVISILRAALKNEVQFTVEERIALRESNSYLRSIGTNLNQIARRTNKLDMAKFTNQAEIRTLISSLLERTKTLNDSILKHTKKVYGLINAAKHRK